MPNIACWGLVAAIYAKLAALWGSFGSVAAPFNYWNEVRMFGIGLGLEAETSPEP